MASKTGIIYILSFKSNDKLKYIGKTTDLQKIIKNFNYILSHKMCNNPKLQKAYNRYGKEGLTFSTLENNIPEKQLEERKNHWINIHDSFHNGLNSQVNGEEGGYRTTSRTIYQYDIHTGELINTFKGFLDASKKTGTNHHSVRFCCMEKNKTAGGFHFSKRKKSPKRVLKDIIPSKTGPAPGSKKQNSIENLYTEKILELHKEGLTQEKIAQEIGCKNATISNILKNNGITSRRAKFITKEELETLYNQGFTQAQLSEKFDYNIGGISRLMKKYKIEIKKRTKKYEFKHREK